MTYRHDEMNDRTVMAVAITLGLLIIITTAAVLLSSGADRGQIDRGFASIVRGDAADGAEMARWRKRDARP